MKNILVTTMGTSWAVVPELYGFTNLADFPFYKNHRNYTDFCNDRRKFNIKPVEEIWVITTNGNRVIEQRKNLSEWQGIVGVKVKQITHPELKELASVEECRLMGDLIFRTILHAKDQSDQLVLSLSGGRKTMSANMQHAGSIMGCDAMLHVVDNGNISDKLKSADPHQLSKILTSKEVSCISPIVVSGKQKQNAVISLNGGIKKEDYPLDICDQSLINEIEHRLNDASSLLVNYRRELIGREQTNFRALYALDPDQICKLKNDKIGCSPDNKNKDINWLKALPKADLHCHFGGILSTKELVLVASSEKDTVTTLCKKYKDYGHWIKNVKKAVISKDLDYLKQQMGESGKCLRNKFSEIREPFAVCGFIIQFQDNIELLDKLIFGNFIEKKSFYGIGIEKYEKLGDLQGSGLLQSKKAIRSACKCLKKQCLENNVIYCELRCSPCNYSRGGLSPDIVVENMIDELSKSANTTFKLLFIASRHGDIKTINAHVSLATRMLNTSKAFKKHFVGFDLAGAESAKQPEQLRTEFLPLLKECINITIHAGEGQPSENIWQAVYHLSADRIGHALSLAENKSLYKRFINRRIAVELCPSSNFQIIGFKDRLLNTSNTPYPLKQYLDDGIHVSINTDDPGISRTNLTNEFYKAACMTKDGLAKWDIFQLIKNSFSTIFAEYQEKLNLILQAEAKLLEIINGA